MEKNLSQNDLELVKRKSRLFEDFTEEESEVGVTGSGRKPKLCKIGMETEGTTASQAQRQMHQFASTVTELCTGFETSKKKNEELGRKVTDLEGQIQKWKDQKASWDEKKKELEREREEARKEALRAVGEKRDMEEKMEKAAKASAKKSICEAVTSLTRCCKNCLDNLVASLANGEGESLKDCAKELVKEILCDDRALAYYEAVHVAGHAGSAMKGGKSQSEAAKPGSRSAVYKRGKLVKVKDLNKPKRPASAFFIFMEDFRKTFKHQSIRSVVVAEAAGDKWKLMSEADKAPYVANAEKRKADYGKALLAYKKKEADEKKVVQGDEFDKSRSEVHDDDDEDDDYFVTTMSKISTAAIYDGDVLKY